MSGDIDDFRALLAKVGNGDSLGIDEAERAFEIMTSGDATPAQMGAFLMGLKVRGETVPLDGEVVIDRGNVDFIQVVG